MSISRREFARLSAYSAASLGLGFSYTPSLLAQAASSRQQIGYCIIGIGRIAEHFLAAIKVTPNSKITGFVSGHPDKAARYAARYGVPSSSIYTYENMDAMRDNKSIDAVIVCLPNSMHAEYTIRPARAGKHVLCEKPMSTSVSDAQAMIDACRTANVKLMIAYRCHYEPSNLRVVKLLREGALGSVQAIESANGYNSGPNEWRLNKKLAGGGPLLDMGIYSLNACRYLTGEEPVEFKACCTTVDKDGRFDQVEESTSWTMKFPSGVVASCNTTYGAQMVGYYRVHGSQGSLELSSAFGYQGQHLKADYWSTKGAPATNLDELNPNHDPSHFILQLDHFSNCVLTNQTPKTPGEEGLRDMQCIQKIYESCGMSL